MVLTWPLRSRSPRSHCESRGALPISVGLFPFFGRFQTAWNELMAAGIVGVLPVLAAFAFAATLVAGAARAETVQFIQCGDNPAPGLQDHIAAFEQANPGTRIELQVVGWAQCEQKVTTLAAAGNPPAVAYLGARTLPQLYESGLVAPVHMPEADRATYYPAVLSAVTYDGQMIGLPIAMSTHALYYNKALFRQAGLDPERPPETWQQLYDAAAAIKAKTGVAGFGIPAKMFNTSVAVFMVWVYSNGGVVLSDGKVVMDSSPNVETLAWYKKMAEVSEAGPSAYAREDLAALFEDGKIAMYETGPWERRRATGKLDYGVAPIPVGPHGKPGDLVVVDTLAVFKGTGVEDQAEKFATFITNPENQRAYELAVGLTPIRPGPDVGELVAKTPSWKPFVDGVSVAGPEPLFQDYTGFQTTIVGAIQAVLLGQQTPEQAAASADAALQKLQ